MFLRMQFRRSLDGVWTEWKTPKSMSKVEKTERSISVYTPYIYSVPTASIVRSLCVPYGVKNQGYDFGGRASRSRTQCVPTASTLRLNSVQIRSLTVVRSQNPTSMDDIIKVLWYSGLFSFLWSRLGPHHACK